jgi:antitoxin component YwqK of YwqJK toxin-antitoxin module
MVVEKAGLIASTALALMLTPQAAVAQHFDVVGTCRAGVPNGAYELRMRDGRLRVAGAFAHGRKTGTFIFWSSRGGRIAVIPYEDDARTGTVALWYLSAGSNRELGRKLEAPYNGNQLHGLKRSWHPDGARRAEFRYEQGVLTEAQAWSTSGRPLSPAEARALATRDASTDERYYQTLEQIVRDNEPHCE